MRKLVNPYLLLAFFVAFLAGMNPVIAHAAPSVRPLVAPTTPVTPALNVTKVGNGTITLTPNQATFNYDQVVTIDVQPDAGWELSSWSGDLAVRMPWWNNHWDYRVAIQVGSQSYERTNKPVETAINFATLFANAGQSGALDENSLRLVEVDLNGNVINDNVPFQFDKDATYNSTDKAFGTIVFLMEGGTAANSGRLYHLYFDHTGKSFTAPTFTPQVILTTIATDEGKASYKIETPSVTYFFHKAGGGFSSMNDIDGDDWINYKKDGIGAAGVFRGIPNMIHPEGTWHPGGSLTNTTIEQQGPLKLTMRVKTTISSGDWEGLWEIYPSYIKMTVFKASHDYWFLYEGTPGGFLDANDFVTLSTGQQLAYDSEWNGELPTNEWAYFSDPNAGNGGRSLFVAKHEDDNQPDSYRKLGNSDGMTVWGFGRKTTTESHFLPKSDLPTHFTFGLINSTAFSATSKRIFDAYKDLSVLVGDADVRTAPQPPAPGTNTPIALNMVMNRNITVTFVKSYHTITVHQIDDEGQPNTNGGSVQISASANPEGYLVGEAATLTATTNPGWRFLGYSGSLLSNDPVATLTVDADEVITATLGQEHYDLSLQLVDQDGRPVTVGPTVTVTDPADPDGYVFEEIADLTVVNQPGWTFVGWSDDLSGSEKNKSLIFDSAKSVTATFHHDYYGLTLNLIDEQGQPVTNGPTINVNAPGDARGYVYDEAVTVTVVNQPGWAFLGWSGDLSGSESAKIVTFDGAKTVTATLRREHYSVTLAIVDLDGQPLTSGPIVEFSTPSDAAGYLYGETATFTVPVTLGWTFLGWSVDLSGNEAHQILTVDGNKRVTASFQQEHYTVAVALVNVDGTAVDAAKVSFTPSAAAAGYVYGEAVTISLVPKNGWNFVHWENGLSGEDNPLTFVVTGDMSTKAIFTQNLILKITYNDRAGGTVTSTPAGPYPMGQQVELTVAPKPGWRFSGWSGDLSGTANPAQITMNSNRTVRANFTEIDYTLNLVVEGVGGSDGGFVVADPTQTVYRYGDQIVLTATPRAGYVFVGWAITPNNQSGIDLTSPVIMITIGDDATYTAIFQPTPGTTFSVYLPVVTN